ncbi:hypothetical protein [Micromonospora sp. C95]|uniref:hypothetical protein n=1 Tax=Micromonospora sp. C95 TaxID=2824882 RepID=UPI001B38C84F|nr:hypothetical protein [Micromonospora sp. C95]MBQ1023792.1 hypothetical protein [Micromonospora sp. C95]
MWLRTAAHGNGRYAEVAPTARASERTIEVISAEFSSPGLLQRQLGRGQIALRLRFPGPSGRPHHAHYHPGDVRRLGEAGWYLALSFVQFGAMRYAWRGSAARRAGDPQPPRDVVNAVQSGSDGLESLIAVYQRLRDADSFPREGYYVDEDGGELLILGKITPSDLH